MKYTFIHVERTLQLLNKKMKRVFFSMWGSNPQPKN